MKKINWVIIFSMFCFIQLSALSFAQPHIVLPPSQVISSNEYQEQGAQSGLVSSIEVLHDSFGGYLYFHKGGWGNGHITKSVEHIPLELPVGTTGSTLENDEPDKDTAINRPIMLAKLEKTEEAYSDSSESSDTEESEEVLLDPLEPINRVFFHFNDKLYFWVMKPLATGYKAVVPQGARVSVRNFFSNLAFPIRFVNCLIQTKFEGAGIETTRFLANSTIGVAGFFDVAAKKFNLKTQDEDLGQTLGVYGMNPTFYINWPVLGPSSFRDTVGLIGDAFIDPLNYLVPRTRHNLMVRSYKTINNTSLTIQDYEDLKEAALDPYIAIRDAYHQYRENKVKE